MDINTKRQILIKSKELRSSEDPVASKLFVNPDLTEKQREKDKELRNKMWKLREEEGRNVIIQKGQIVDAPYNVRKTRTARPQTSNVSNQKNTVTTTPKQSEITSSAGTSSNNGTSTQTST